MAKKKSKHKDKKSDRERASSSITSDRNNYEEQSAEHKQAPQCSNWETGFPKEGQEARRHHLQGISGIVSQTSGKEKASTPLTSQPRSASIEKSKTERKRRREESEMPCASKHRYRELNYKNDSMEARQESQGSNDQKVTLKAKKKKKKASYNKKQLKCRTAELAEEITFKHPKLCSYLFSTKHMPEKWNNKFKIPKKLCDHPQTSVNNESSPQPQTSKAPSEKSKQLNKTETGLGPCNSNLSHMTQRLLGSSKQPSTIWASSTRKDPKQECNRPATCSEAKGAGFHRNAGVRAEQMQIIEELHAARNEKKLDLDVVQSCGELTSMDVEFTDEDPTLNLSADSTQLNFLIVLDTNILLSHLPFVENLKTMGMPGIGRFVLIIPWVVLQELDYMKTGKLLEHVKFKAIPAVRFIYNSLKRQDPRLWGQSMQLASEKIYGLSNENNDDRVLQCCLQYQKFYPHTAVILCTDDKNLCSKALVSGVKSLSKADLTLELQKLSTSTTPQTLPQPEKDADPQKNDKEAVANAAISKAVLDLEICLGKALSFILETEMKIAFEDLWMEVLYLKPPWTLADLLQCVKKHWIAVFGQILKRDLLETVDNLYRNLYRGGPVDYSKAKFLVQESCNLLHAFSSRSDYDGVLPQAYSELNKLLQTGLEGKSSCLQPSVEATKASVGNPPCNKTSGTTLSSRTCKETAASSTAASPSPARAQEIWCIFERIWNTISEYSAEVFQKLNYNQTLFPPQASTKLGSAEEAFLCLQKLMATVKDVLAGIQRILAPNSSCEDAWTLCNFLSSPEINLMPATFTAQELYECLSQKEYREKLTIGCCQLAQLEYTMKHCHDTVQAKTGTWM